MNPAGNEQNPERKQEQKREAIASPMLDRIAVMLAAWPWWAVVILIGLVIAVYSLLTSPIYHRALTFVSDNPQLSTNRIANVSYNVRQPDVTTSSASDTLPTETTPTIPIFT